MMMQLSGKMWSKCLAVAVKYIVIVFSWKALFMMKRFLIK